MRLQETSAACIYHLYPYKTVYYSTRQFHCTGPCCWTSWWRCCSRCRRKAGCKN